MDGTKVYYINQNRLPFIFTINEANTYTGCCTAITEMQVRGAGAIGALAGYAMALACLQAPAGTYLAYIQQARSAIESTRPTARNLFYATALVFAAGLNSPEEAVRQARLIADQDAADSLKIGEAGNRIIRDGTGILTHCNAGWLAFVDYGTALSPIYQAHQQGKRVFVYVDETRPRCQGARLSAWELNQAGVPHAIIADNAAAFYMAKGAIDLVITGADRIAINGDTANKVGTLEKAICAKEFNIPFYIAAPLSTFDPECPSGKEIFIEERRLERPPIKFRSSASPILIITPESNSSWDLAKP